MKRRVGLLLISLLIVLLMNNPVMGEDNYLFQMTDPQGDEYGPGTYIYPTSQQFVPFEGLFDLLNFKVKDVDSNYIFELKFTSITNPWHAKYGFSHQLVQIYIDNDLGGATNVFKKGANVKFDPDTPWNKLIKINGWNIKVFDYQDKPTAKDGDISEAEVQILDDQQTIQVSIPKKKIGDLKAAKYYLLVGSLDGFSYDNYRPVVKEVSEWKFGGGTDTEFNPNVLDILVPEDKEQKEILSSYDVKNGEFAMIYSVGSKSKISSKLIVILVTLAIIIIIPTIIKYKKELLNFNNK
ncbi:glucodextranase DOMON-like domain-containing protein [Selenihalanaerobacter shriftii]|uniref:C-terminal binding-module, SLH-like, of glucodextranase n=1 Tax=Selenihalanaerobacter shriftii TaxID=142842 RepID=A0A1T4KI41_9FIRM|nr:glucodextranase DOMON-like domain-containing protein [Selenihalanaerobacter shriftii]SJZ42046.1 C-terminal binding-module, SLH-like, of glucodextranase [Selenihalanaerobacter shriftii]